MILFINLAFLNAYFSILEILFLKEEPDIIIKYHELFIYICIFYVQINGFYVEINDIQFKIKMVYLFEIIIMIYLIRTLEYSFADSIGSIMCGFDFL